MKVDVKKYVKKDTKLDVTKNVKLISVKKLQKKKKLKINNNKNSVPFSKK